MNSLNTLTVVNPVTGEAIAAIPRTPLHHLPAIIAQARVAQHSWARLSVAERSALCDRLIDILRDRTRTEFLVNLIHQETGTPRNEIDSAEIGTVMLVAQYYRRVAKRLLKTKKIKTHQFFRFLKRTRVVCQSRGVVAVITPMNFPFCFALDDAIPALIAGNAVIVKPSEKNPQSALQAKALIAECGLPADLFQVVIGEADLGEALVKCDGINMVCFTGSTETGRKVATSCADRLIPCHLELSGKAPAIVFADAPLKRAARGIVWSSFFHSGQDCVSTERVYVHTSVHDRFVELVVNETRKLKFERDLGPLLTSHQHETIARHVKDAVEKGVRIACGGSTSGGYYLPTILTGVTSEMAVAREETFGPLMSIISFSDVADVIRQANDSPFGLQATIWTRDKNLADRCCREIHAGNILINEGLINFSMIETPFGGIKQSGIGARHGEEGLLRFTTPLTIVANRFSLPSELYWFPYTRRKGAILKSLRSFFFHPLIRKWFC